MLQSLSWNLGDALTIGSMLVFLAVAYGGLKADIRNMQKQREARDKEVGRRMGKLEDAVGNISTVVAKMDGMLSVIYRKNGYHPPQKDG